MPNASRRPCIGNRPRSEADCKAAQTSRRFAELPEGDMMDRRSFVVGTTALVAAGPVFAQETFPSHAITIINAFPPGGANDIVTRPFASALEPIVKQPVVVETKAGAGGQVGAQVVASAKPDGYTLLSHNNGISGYEEVDKLFGRPAQDDARRFHSAGAADRRPGAAPRQRSATIQDAQGIHRRRQKAARGNQSTVRAASMARPICRWRCSKRRPASRSFGTCRPTAADRPSPRCSATTPK